jgi:hypothetical protein
LFESRRCPRAEVRPARRVPSPAICPTVKATAGRIGLTFFLRQSSALRLRVGVGMREVLMVYLCGVILLLAVSTMIEDGEEVGLDHILIAGFGWPILTPILALRAWSNR